MDIGGHRRRHAAGQHQLEMPPRQPVLPVHEKGPGQLQAHPDQLRTVDQDEPKGGDGLVVQLLARLVAVGLLGLAQRRHADVKQGSGTVNTLGRCLLRMCCNSQQDTRQ